MALTWPSSELPMPNGTIGRRCFAQTLTMSATSSVDCGKTTASGSPGACHDSPWLWCSRTASDTDTRSPRIDRSSSITQESYRIEGSMEPLRMFTPKTLSFLRSLKRNNKREWFHERRDQYEQHCRGPMIEIVRRLNEDFRSFAPEMLADPKVCLLRPFRDTRFSEDKTPVKTHVGATFPHRALGRMNGAGFYFEVAPAWVWIGGGLGRADPTRRSPVTRDNMGGPH